MRGCGVRSRSFRIRSALGLEQKSAFTSSDYGRAELYRPISCQLTYKGTNCLSNLKDAAKDVTRKESARAQNERRDKIEREKTNARSRKKGRGAPGPKEKRRRRNERDERAEDRWFAYACSRTTCVRTRVLNFNFHSAAARY